MERSEVSGTYLSIDERLFLPAETQALLWDLDGTLVDSFRFDLEVCSGIMSQHAGREIAIPEKLLREGFALSGVDFWSFIFSSLGVSAEPHAYEAAYKDWAAERASRAFPINEGVLESLDAARAIGLRQAVVSNNPQHEVMQVVRNSGLIDCFDLVVGNDGSGRAKKPAPDSYLFAASSLGLAPDVCAAFEDSVLGLKAARAAGAYVVAIASGAEEFQTLRSSGLADACYTALSRSRVALVSGRQHAVKTPSECITTFITGLSSAASGAVQVDWNNDNWELLGLMTARLLSPQ